MRSRSHLVVALGLASLLGCSGEEGREARDARGGERTAVGGDVVSTVDGIAITRADVERAARETGLDPPSALRRLQEAELLAAEAERRGGASSARVRTVQRQAMVQRLLAEAESVVSRESIRDEEVLEAWRARRGASAPEPTEAVKADIRSQLLTLRRFNWVRELVARLEVEQGVERNEAAIEASGGHGAAEGGAP